MPANVLKGPKNAMRFKLQKLRRKGKYFIAAMSQRSSSYSNYCVYLLIAMIAH